MKLRAILLILGLLAFFSASVGGYLYYSASKQSVLNEAETQAASQAEIIKTLLSSYLSNNLNAVRALAGLKGIQQAFLNPDETALTEADFILDNFKNSLGANVSYMMDKEGKTIASSNRNERNSFVGKNYSFRPYFQNAIHGDSSIYMALGVTSKKRGIYYSYPVYERIKKSPIGVVILKTPAEAIERELLGTLYHAPGMFKLITGPNGLVFMSCNKKFLYQSLWKITDGERAKIQKSKQFGKGPWEWAGFERRGTDRAVDKSGNEYLMFQKEVESLPGWNIVHLSNLETISKRVSTPFVRIVGYLILILCALIGISVFILYRLAKSDIINRLTAEKALLESEEKYKGLFGNAQVALFRTRISDGELVEINERYANMAGYSNVEDCMAEFNLADAWADANIRNEMVRVLKEKGSVNDYETEIIRRDGTRIWIMFSATIFPEQGFIEGSIVDINERKLAEEALWESEEKYRTILESMEEGYYEVDLAGNFIFFNDAMCKIRGYSREELMGMSNREYMTEETAKEVFKAFSNVYTTGKPAKNLEWETIRKDGTKGYVETSASLVKNSAGESVGFRGVVRDISEKHRLEAQLQQAHKMESIGTLAGGIAHNFNNLLMGIQGNASIMLLDIDSSNPRHKNLKNIEKLVEHGAKLTAQLIGYAREGKYEVNFISLNQLVKETSDTFGMTKKEITVHQKLSEKLYGIKADQGQIEQVLLNLYVNAADAMPGGGDLFLKTMNVADKDITGKPYEVNPGNYVLLTVRDTGVGMDKETKERIFEPFFTTKGLASGTGLGLASAYGIIKGHGGYIDVDSKVGEGTTFNIFLPATEKVIKEKRVLPDKLVAGKGTVLLVDDEEMVLEAGEVLLNHLGYEVLLAENGQEALDLYKKHRDKIDLVLLDMVMPVMGGGEAFDRIKEINTNVKVLLSSGYSLEGEAKEILKRGCDAFIQKPFKMEQLSHKIQELLHKR